MPRRIACALLGCAALAGSSAWGASLLQVYDPAAAPMESGALVLHAGAFAADDMVPLRRVTSSTWPADYRTRAGTNVALADARVDLGAVDHGVQVGVFYRQDWLARANRDTVDAYVLNQRDALASQDRSYVLDERLRGFAARGVRVGYSRALALAGGGLRVGASLSLLQATRLLDDTAQGALLTAGGSGTLSGQRTRWDSAAQPVASSSSFNAFVPPAAQGVPTGQGWGVDLGADWRRGRYALRVAADDLGARIHWSSMPMIVQDIAGLSVPYTDPTGSPAVSGVNVYRPYTLRLDPKYHAAASVALARATVVASVDAQAGCVLPQLALRGAVAPGWDGEIGYESRFGSVGVALRHQHFELALRSDRLALSDSRALGLSVDWSARF